MLDWSLSASPSTAFSARQETAVSRLHAEGPDLPGGHRQQGCNSEDSKSLPEKTQINCRSELLVQICRYLRKLS